MINRDSQQCMPVSQLSEVGDHLNTCYFLTLCEHSGISIHILKSAKGKTNHSFDDTAGEMKTAVINFIILGVISGELFYLMQQIQENLAVYKNPNTTLKLSKSNITIAS